MTGLVFPEDSWVQVRYPDLDCPAGPELEAQ
jgi:hypothetical protein